MVTHAMHRLINAVARARRDLLWQGPQLRHQMSRVHTHPHRRTEILTAEPPGCSRCMMAERPMVMTAQAVNTVDEMQNIARVSHPPPGPGR